MAREGGPEIVRLHTIKRLAVLTPVGQGRLLTIESELSILSLMSTESSLTTGRFQTGAFIGSETTGRYGA
jgi:hypothetical protein